MKWKSHKHEHANVSTADVFVHAFDGRSTENEDKAICIWKITNKFCNKKKQVCCKGLQKCAKVCKNICKLVVSLA